MTFEQRYKKAKKRMLEDPAICEQNRKIFAKFFEYLEYKLKRINSLAELDESAYKTVSYYISRLRTVNLWFENKPWEDLTKEDIKRVYDGVEDGKILTPAGKPYRGTEAYFRRVMRGKPFELAGKKDLAVAVMEFYQPRNKSEVRFIREESFRLLVDQVTMPEHKVFLWLAWDIGENAYSLLQLRKSDFDRQIDADTNEPEYTVQLRREILKRSRTARVEITNYSETVRHLDLLLGRVGDNELLFQFGPRMAAKLLERAVRITGATCLPGGQRVTLKDLRSSMACDLLSKGWHTDEVNFRLGHNPSSREIDKYVNWLALDKRHPKKRVQDGKVTTLTRSLDDAEQRERLSAERLTRYREENESLKTEFAETKKLVTALQDMVNLLRTKSIAV